MATYQVSPTPTPERLPPPGPVSYEEFLDWCDEDTLAEWLGGEIELTSPASVPHQKLFKFLLFLLDTWVERHGLGIILPAPFQMHLPPPVNRGREPDILFVATSRLDRLRNTFLEGPADVAIEITSPESLVRDRLTKLDEYQRAGVSEYWLLDIIAGRATFRELGPDGRYRVMLDGAGGTYTSPALRGLRLPVEWLWQDPLPDRFDALRELGLLN